MKSMIFEILQKSGLIKRGKIQINTVINLPFTELIDLIDVIAFETTKSDHILSPSIHTHCASIDLGGGRDECWAIECRMKAANELAHFAALYSDKVVIHNFLADHAPSWGHPPDKDTPRFRHTIINDLYILIQLRPLIEAEKILVFTPPATICPYCYAKKLFGTKADLRLEKAIKKISQDLLKSSVDLRFDGVEYEINITTEMDLFKHTTHYSRTQDLPEIFRDNHKLADRLKNGDHVLLNDKEKRMLGIHSKLAEGVLISLRYQMSVADVMDASFLTQRKIDVKLLSYMSDDESIDTRNMISENYLKSIVPFVGDVPIKDLIRLREREEEAFIQFRSAMDSAMKQVINEKQNFTESDAKILYSDVILPELSNLDIKVKEAKRDLIKTPLLSSVATMAVLAFGLYSGMIPDELKVVAASLGLSKIIFDTVTKTLDQLDVEKTIRPEKFYYLWKIKQLNQRQ